MGSIEKQEDKQRGEYKEELWKVFKANDGLGERGRDAEEERRGKGERDGATQTGFRSLGSSRLLHSLLPTPDTRILSSARTLSPTNSGALHCASPLTHIPRRQRLARAHTP